MLDILIKNGSVLDGSGKPALKADVGIAEDRIVISRRILSRKLRESLMPQASTWLRDSLILTPIPTILC